MTRIALRVAYSAERPPPEITCSACGARELQSGIAVESSAITTRLAESGEAQSVVDTRDAQPLCDCCTRFLLVAQQG
jgi:hypothetical protein